MKKRLVVFVLAASVASVAACGDSSFGSANGADGGDDDGSNSVTGGRADGGSDDASAEDASADASSMADVPCVPETADATVGFFVDHNSTAGVTCGDVTAPCKTIQPAIDLIPTIAGKSVVYVALGTYVENITLKPGVTIKGGWKNTGATFSRACSANPAGGVVIQAPTSNVTLKVASLGGSATLDTLTLSSRIAPAAPGESMYGIFATGASTTLRLDNVVVQTARAGSANPVAPAGSGTHSCAAASTGASGAPASGVAPAASAGSYSLAGYTPGAGNAGPPGNAGENGAQGQPATGSQCVSGWPGCDEGACMFTGSNTTSCAGPGTPGCGGPPGLGGGGGGGGGSSLGVFAWGATVSASASSITAGAGGAGAQGGSGGPASPGDNGQRQQTSLYYDCSDPLMKGTCPNVFTHTSSSASAGTVGGNGTAGLAGGGGPGGDSYAVYKGAGASYTGTTTMLVAGVAGGAGTGNPAGPGGTSALSN